MSNELRRERDVAAEKSCTHCGAAMKVIATIKSVAGEPGLIAYECPSCWYVTSDLNYPGGTDDRL
jgi:hypothetical protein